MTQSTQTKSQWFCKHCDKKFDSYKGLRLHETHSQCRSPLTCDLCMKTFSTIRQTNRHKKSVQCKMRHMILTLQKRLVALRQAYMMQCHYCQNSSTEDDNSEEYPYLNSDIQRTWINF